MPAELKHRARSMACWIVQQKATAAFLSEAYSRKALTALSSCRLRHMSSARARSSYSPVLMTLTEARSRRRVPQVLARRGAR